MNLTTDFSNNWIWTTEKTTRLISLYQLYPSLYNSKSNDYKNKVMRQKIWEVLGQHIGTSSTEVAKKVRGLRTQYAREKAKIMLKHREGSSYTSPWIHYNALKFLDEFTTTRGSKYGTNRWIDYSQDPAKEYEDDEQDELIEPSSYMTTEIKSEPTDSDDCMIVAERPHSLSTTNEKPMISPPEPQHSIAKKPAKRRFSSSSPRWALASPPLAPEDQLESVAVETREEDQPKQSKDNDSDEIFAKYVASELRQIKDSHMKRIVKNKIQNVIFEAHCTLHQNT